MRTVIEERAKAAQPLDAGDIRAVGVIRRAHISGALARITRYGLGEKDQSA